MKDLILIGAHCPDDERENFLSRLVDQLQIVKQDFDILICSHLVVPEYITKKVDYVFYDKNNDLIYDTKYLNQPWFSPFEGLTILSTLIGEHSTYLAVYRLLISGLGISKIFGYEKVHYIEYDTDFRDISELYLHSKLLEDNDWVAIHKTEKNFSLNNIAWPIGNFYSFKVNSIDDVFTRYNKENLLKILEESPSKTNEKITNDIMTTEGKKVYLRDYFNDLSKENTFGLSRMTSKESLSYWAVPYYDTKKDLLCLVVWNNRDDGPININFIINNNNVVRFEDLKKFEWSIKEVCPFNEIKTITTLINGKVKNNLEFTEDYKRIFKKTNHTLYR